MHTFEWLYLAFGSFVVSAGLVMVTVYSFTQPWWKAHLGRMVIVYAAAEILMSLLLLTTVVFHFSPHWFRVLWFVLQVTVGCTFWFQTAVLLKLHRARRRREMVQP
jgi:hypothetical protein